MHHGCPSTEPADMGVGQARCELVNAVLLLEARAC